MIRDFAPFLAGLSLALAASGIHGQTPPVPQHGLAGRDRCLTCHAASSGEGVPEPPAESHAGMEDASCPWCHAAAADVQSRDPPAIAHELVGQERCLMCHAALALDAVPDVPEGHAGRPNESCEWCHKAAAWTGRGVGAPRTADVDLPRPPR